MTDQEFQKHSEAELDALKRSLFDAESDADFEVEEANGALQVNFETPPARFIVSPNSPVRQIWISALSTSFKLDWVEAENKFVLPKTGEDLKRLLSRLINQQLGDNVVQLS
ncbi:MAG TPA: iron donor protein CyaY [Candidatus Koribacter sp.]|jgi:CyaY protein